MNVIDDFRARALALSKLSKPSPEDVGRALSTTLKQSYESKHRVEHESSDVPLPFTTARLMHTSGARTTLELVVADDQHIPEQRLELRTNYGVPIETDINPRIGPEGVTTYTFTLGAATIAFEMTGVSLRLRRAFISWPAHAA